ncbi:hypothetical protein [Propionivibrio sp.]
MWAACCRRGRDVLLLDSHPALARH